MDIAEGAGGKRLRQARAEITLLCPLCRSRRAACALRVRRQESAADGAGLRHRPDADGVGRLVVYANHAVGGAPVEAGCAARRAASIDAGPERAVLRAIRPAGEQAAVGVAEVVVEGVDAAAKR